MLINKVDKEITKEILLETEVVSETMLTMFFSHLPEEGSIRTWFVDPLLYQLLKESLFQNVFIRNHTKCFVKLSLHIFPGMRNSRALKKGSSMYKRFLMDLV